MAIVLDGKIISAPVIRDTIASGSGQISGGFTFQSATDLALLLRSGALPAPLNIIDYVICHELCHLKYMNHSKEFWNLVGDVFPQYNQAESYLKEKGLALYKLD